MGVKDNDNGMFVGSSVECKCGCMDFSHIIICFHRANLRWLDLGSIEEWNGYVFLPVWGLMCVEVNCEEECRRCNYWRF